jgi:hypothetical protein
MVEATELAVRTLSIALADVPDMAEERPTGEAKLIR